MRRPYSHPLCPSDEALDRIVRESVERVAAQVDKCLRKRLASLQPKEPGDE